MVTSVKLFNHLLCYPRRGGSCLTRFSRQGQCESRTLLKISFQAWTTSSMSSKTNSASQGACWSACSSCYSSRRFMLRYLMRVWFLRALRFSRAYFRTTNTGRWSARPMSWLVTNSIRWGRLQYTWSRHVLLTGLVMKSTSCPKCIPRRPFASIIIARFVPVVNINIRNNHSFLVQQVDPFQYLPQ